MRKRNMAVSLGMVLVVLPEPVTTVVALVLIFLWCLLQRKRNRDLNFISDNLGDSLDIVET